MPHFDLIKPEIREYSFVHYVTLLWVELFFWFQCIERATKCVLKSNHPLSVCTTTNERILQFGMQTIVGVLKRWIFNFDASAWVGRKNSIKSHLILNVSLFILQACKIAVIVITQYEIVYLSMRKKCKSFFSLSHSAYSLSYFITPFTVQRKISLLLFLKWLSPILM